MKCAYSAFCDVGKYKNICKFREIPHKKIFKIREKTAKNICKFREDFLRHRRGRYVYSDLHDDLLVVRMNFNLRLFFCLFPCQKPLDLLFQKLFLKV